MEEFHMTTCMIKCQEMYVPGFGDASPESKAAKHLHDFFTYVAVRIVDAQLESYNFEAHAELQEFLEKHPLNDGDKFWTDLMRESSRHKALGSIRILQERFRVGQLEALGIASEMVEKRNTRLMRDYVSETILPTENDS